MEKTVPHRGGTNLSDRSRAALADGSWLDFLRGTLKREFLFLLALSLGIYWVGFDNGFISDDYMFLERIREWPDNPWFLFKIPPENFRSTTYLAFFFLKTIAGYQSAFFYLFTILLHAANAFLLGRLILWLTGDPRTAFYSAVLFAAFQNPQEAVLWLGGMHEALLGLFLLAALLCWTVQKWSWCLIFYCLALFSKESAPVLLLLIPVLEFWRQKRIIPPKQFGLLLIPTFGFGLLFLYQIQDNSLVSYGFYAFGSHALVVFLKSLHSLAFPWLYLLGLAVLKIGPDRPLPSMVGPLAWIVAALLPYVFLTYMDHVPSRHEHLASMGVAAALALLLRWIEKPRFTQFFLIFFVLMNAGYILFKKDAQFEERAAPTARLVQELRVVSPSNLLLVDFPLYPGIAKSTARTVPGWEPELIAVNTPLLSCTTCLKLRWDAKRLRYDRVP